MILSGPEACPALADAIPQPAEEGQRLVRVAETEQRVNGKRRVAYPREPVVPVALATDLLGQARRGSGHERARRRVRHQLERHRGAADRLTPATGIRRATEPAAPEPDRLVEPGEDALGVDRCRGLPVGSRFEDRAADVAGSHRPSRAHSLPSGWSSTVARSARSISSVSKMKPSPTARSRCSALRSRSAVGTRG